MLVNFFPPVAQQPKTAILDHTQLETHTVVETGDQLLAEVATCTSNNTGTNIRALCETRTRDQSSGCRSTPYTARLPGSDVKITGSTFYNSP